MRQPLLGHEVIRLIERHQRLGVASLKEDVLCIIDAHGLIDRGVQDHERLAQVAQVLLWIGISKVFKEVTRNGKRTSTQSDLNFTVCVDLTDFVCVVKHGVCRVERRTDGSYCLE